MRVFLDENFPFSLERRLKNDGYEAEHVITIGWRGASDARIRERLVVFLTPKGDTNGLYVTDQSASGFEVRESKSGSSTVEFSYRVVAKRKDVVARRLERVTLPQRRPLLVPRPVRHV